MTIRKKVLRLLFMLVCLPVFVFLVSCEGGRIAKPKDEDQRINKGSRTLTGTSDTGVKVSMYGELETDKQVGMFYFIWHGTGLGSSYGTNYDNSKILKNIDFSGGRKSINPEEWLEAGGGGRGDFHWWGEPLFGYYDIADEWVVTRHVKMLTDAGVDFLMIDFTNGVWSDYIDRLEVLFKVLDKFHKQGFSVPKVVCAAYDDSPRTVDELYSRFYSKNPQYDHLFYRWKDSEKPLMFDNIEGYNKKATGFIDTESKLASYSEGAREFFDFRDLAFPHETKNNNDFGSSFLYLDFRVNPSKVTDGDGFSFCCVSVSEISVTNRASAQWFEDSRDRTRSFDGKENRNWKKGEEDAYLYGYNFKRQFEYAIKEDPDMIFVTGWNEWIAQLQIRSNGEISFVDAADINNSRDIEPMNGGYGDNYYMQLCHYISKFKYGNVKNEPASSISIDVKGDFDQWDNENILTYVDYVDDVFDRNKTSAHNWSLKYTNTTGQNDIKTVKVTSDKNNVYFYVDTVDPIVNFEGERSMTLFINTGSKTNWYGYDFAVHRTGGSDMIIEKCKGGYEWDEVGKAEYKLSENMLMLSIPRKTLGVSGKEFSISFKWADNFSGDGDIFTFYTDGNAAPYGRLNYLYVGEK